MRRSPVPDYEQFARIAEAMVGTGSAKLDGDLGMLASLIRERKLDDPQDAWVIAMSFHDADQSEQIGAVCKAILERAFDA